MKFEGSRLFILLAIVLSLSVALAGVALFGFFRASNYGVRLNQINETGDMMPELFRD